MNKSFAIFLGVVLLLLALIPIFFKMGDVPDVDWGSKYNLKSKDPNGLWVMMEMLRERYGAENIIIDPAFNAINYEDDEELYLYLAISSRLAFSNHESEVLEEFVNYYGNSAMLIANDITFDGNLIDVSVFSYPMLDDSLVVDYLGDSLSTGIYKNYSGNFEESAPFMKGKLKVMEDELLESGGLINPLIKINSDTCAYRIAFESNSITLHSMPGMFTNSAAIQDFYLQHLNYIFNTVNATKVVLTLPTNESFAKQSPLSILLKNRSLKSAYYFLLFALATLLIFATKRKQPRVKTYQALANTSLESASSLARMHEVFGSNEGFIDVIERNFYYQIKKTFGISETDPSFLDKMAKKSGVDMDLIEWIIKDIKRLKAKCSDSQLIQLRNKIVKFNKNIADG